MTTPNSRATLKPATLKPLSLKSLSFAQIVSCIIVLGCNFYGQVRVENDEEVAEA